MGFKCNSQNLYLSGRISAGYTMGVKYIHAWMIIWYMSFTSGKYTATVERIKLTPNANAVKHRIGIGTKRNAHVMGLPIANKISRSGTRDSTRLTTPVPMDEMEKAVMGI